MNEALQAYATNDFVTARLLLKPYAEANDPLAQFTLAYLLYSGSGTARNLPQAVTWYQRAAEAAHADSQYNLGYLHLSGEGVPEDSALARKWFLAAAAQNHALAAYELGRMAIQGIGGRQNLRAALRWYAQASELGLQIAQKAHAALEQQFIQDRFITTKPRVNLRQAPAGEIITRLPKAAEVLVLTRNANWWRIAALDEPGLNGWIFAELLTPAENTQR